MENRINIERIKDLAGKMWRIVTVALSSFQQEGAARGAAGTAYYTLFSFFPLLIILVTIASFFVSSYEASSKVAQLVISVIPVSQKLVEVNIQRILELRNSVGIVMLLVLLWSGSNAFSMMVHHINSAWPETERRTFFQQRLFGLAMVIAIILLLFILMLSSTFLNVLVKYKNTVPGLDLLFNTWLWSFGTKVLYWAVPFLFFYSLYRIIPMGRVPVKAAGFSALGITLIWRLASTIFQWYLRSGFARYEIIFGSLSAIVVLLFWIYISAMILFFGAHLCAASSGKVSLEKGNGIIFHNLKKNDSSK
ncbi:MAG: YihY/virulence factor BrkB family protein [Anaerolineales bacterium]|nr:YihY/virulence factor BrkB family protein [Anaerolineales bacterium]